MTKKTKIIKPDKRYFIPDPVEKGIIHELTGSEVVTQHPEWLAFKFIYQFNYNQHGQALNRTRYDYVVVFINNVAYQVTKDLYQEINILTLDPEIRNGDDDLTIVQPTHFYVSWAQLEPHKKELISQNFGIPLSVLNGEQITAPDGTRSYYMNY